MKEKHELKVVSIRMVEDPPLLSETPLDSPDKVVDFMAEELGKYDRELFCILNLKAKSQVINMNIVAMGSLDSVAVSPREVFKSSILSNAASVILLHNHPSGICEPSREDILFTMRLRECGEMIGIPVADHIITGGKGKYYSFMEAGILDKKGTVRERAAAESRSGRHTDKKPKR